MSAWRAAIEAEPDTPYAVLAGNLLHPKSPRGLPAFIPSFAAPAEIVRLAPRRQLDALRQRAERDGTRELLLYGVGLQRVGRPVSAAAAFARAARRAPANAEAQVAAAVGQFDKDAPERAFGRLGPLTRRFPDEPTVRFHLGVLLLWTGRVTPRSGSSASRRARSQALRLRVRLPAISRPSATHGPEPARAVALTPTFPVTTV